MFDQIARVNRVMTCFNEWLDEECYDFIGYAVMGDMKGTQFKLSMTGWFEESWMLNNSQNTTCPL